MQVWDSLGITASQPHGSWLDVTEETADSLFAPFLPEITKIPRVRALRQEESETSKVAVRLWAKAIKEYSPSTYVMYGLARSSSTYLPTYYETYIEAMLDDAQWAQDNGIDEFCAFNEFEISTHSGSLSITSISRSSNISTVETSSEHGLSTGDTVNISGANESAFNGNDLEITVTDETHFTYSNSGSDGSASGTIILRCGTATIIRFEKLIAVEAQLVFTRGPIIGSWSQGYQDYIIAAGITPNTDLDHAGFNSYGGNSLETFIGYVTAMHDEFGDNLVITEFNQHASWGSTRAKGYSPSQRGFDEAYSDEVYRKLVFLRDLGITQAYFFTAWNASSPENNNFTAWYNTNSTTGNGGKLQGDWKSIFDRLLEQRISRVMLGT